MTWRTRFVAVPVGLLVQDELIAPSPKATNAQMRAYMAPVPEVYRRLATGIRPENFQRMRASSEPGLRAVGDTFHYLFSPAGTDHRLEAEFQEGKGLVVTRGRHRLEAARELALPYLPVHIRAIDQQTLDAVCRGIESTPGLANSRITQIQQELDSAHVSFGPNRTRSPSPSIAEPSDKKNSLIRRDEVTDRAPFKPVRDPGR